MTALEVLDQAIVLIERHIADPQTRAAIFAELARRLAAEQDLRRATSRRM